MERTGNNMQQQQGGVEGATVADGKGKDTKCGTETNQPPQARKNKISHGKICITMHRKITRARVRKLRTPCATNPSRNTHLRSLL